MPSVCEADEGDLFARIIHGGSLKGTPCPNSEGVFETRRGGTEGESAEGREKPPWGVPLPRAGQCPAPTQKTHPPLYLP